MWNLNHCHLSPSQHFPHSVPATSTPRTVLPAWWVLTASVFPDELLPDEQNRAAKGLRERKRKVKAHNAIRERSNMPTALPPAVDWSGVPIFGWHTRESRRTHLWLFSLLIQAATSIWQKVWVITFLRCYSGWLIVERCTQAVKHHGCSWRIFSQPKESRLYFFFVSIKTDSCQQKPWPHCNSFLDCSWERLWRKFSKVRCFKPSPWHRPNSNSQKSADAKFYHQSTFGLKEEIGRVRVTSLLPWRHSGKHTRKAMAVWRAKNRLRRAHTFRARHRQCSLPRL